MNKKGHRQPLSTTLKHYSIVMLAPMISDVIVADTPKDNVAQDLDASNEQQDSLEISAMTKLRDCKVRMSSLYGPYTDMNLQDILRPADRLESIVMRQHKRHAANNHQMELIASGVMEMVEQEQSFMRPIYRLISILHGDDDLEPASDKDPETLECCRVVQEFVNLQAIFIARVQEIRDKVMSIHTKKRQLLKLLRNQYLDAMNDDQPDDHDIVHQQQKAKKQSRVNNNGTTTETGRRKRRRVNNRNVSYNEERRDSPALTANEDNTQMYADSDATDTL